MNAQNVTAILHLSDLHLGNNFEDVGSFEGGISRTLKSLWKQGGLKMQAHDPLIVATLHTSMKAAARELGLPNDKFDFLVVTGDISTTADTVERFQFAKNFLGGALTSSGMSIGLSFPNDSILCIPGNHDKMNEQSPTRYLNSFSTLPAVPPYVTELCAHNGTRFTFYGIDSNLYEEGNVAKGKISLQTLAWLANERERSASTAADSQTIRVLLLHHHPCDLNRFRRRTLQNALTKRLTQLEEGELLLDMCRDWIHVIMHGHEHLPVAFQDEKSGAVIVSSGTTCEMQTCSGVNSFFALLFDQQNIRVVEYRWTGVKFQKQDKEYGSWPLAVKNIS